MAQVCLGLHDFSVVNNRLDLLLKLKQYFPDFKVSLFTVPYDEPQDWGPFLLLEEFLTQIKENLDWIQIIPHGLQHKGREMRGMESSQFKLCLLRIEQLFKKNDIPYINGFCAPHYAWSSDVVRVLDEMGWWGAIPRDKVIPTPKRFYKFSHIINEPFWESKDPALKLHGHVYGTKSDLGKCFDNLLKLPIDTDWHFCTDFLEEKT